MLQCHHSLVDSEPEILIAQLVSSGQGSVYLSYFRDTRVSTALNSCTSFFAWLEPRASGGRCHCSDEQLAGNFAGGLGRFEHIVLQVAPRWVNVLR